MKEARSLNTFFRPITDKLHSPKFEVLNPDRSLPRSGDASRAADHAYHQLDRLLVAQVLRARHRAPRLEVQGETYGTEQQPGGLAGRPPTGSEGLPHPFPVDEDRLHYLGVRL